VPTPSGFNWNNAYHPGIAGTTNDGFYRPAVGRDFQPAPGGMNIRNGDGTITFHPCQSHMGVNALPIKSPVPPPPPFQMPREETITELVLRSAREAREVEEAAPKLATDGAGARKGGGSAKGGSPPALTEGQAYEAAQLNSLHFDKSTFVFRPSLEETETAAFQIIVGSAKFTRGGQLKGTIFDGTGAGLLEIKGGSSELTSSYQLRLQTYYSVKNNMPFTIRTTRPVNKEFGSWLQRWGVRVEKP
jgi:hypothetical protein